MIENDKQVELWFGEVKFHKNYTSGINSALDNIKKAISDDYFKRNILVISDRKKDFNYKSSKIESIINKWENNPLINIVDEVKKHKIKLIYPIMLIYESSACDYDSDIKKVPQYIFKKYKPEKFNLSIEYTIFFILLPLKGVGKVKQEVIKWIESKKPLMS